MQLWGHFILFWPGMKLVARVKGTGKAYITQTHPSSFCTYCWTERASNCHSPFSEFCNPYLKDIWECLLENCRNESEKPKGQPFFSAFVLIAETSDPAPGSVTQYACNQVMYYPILSHLIHRIWIMLERKEGIKVFQTVGQFSQKRNSNFSQISTPHQVCIPQPVVLSCEPKRHFSVSTIDEIYGECHC